MPEYQSVVQDTVFGETTDEFVLVLDADTRGLYDKIFFIKNTGDTNRLEFKVGRTLYQGNKTETPIESFELFSPGLERMQVDPQDIEELSEEEEYATIKIYVRSSSTGQSTTYQIDWNGR